MPHSHHGHRHHHEVEGSDSRLVWAVAVNLGLTVAQIVGGLLSGSLALIADALHNLSDALSLVIAFAARRIARRPADMGMTFGYARAETVAALINYTTLIVLGLYLGYQAVMRLFAPEPVEGWMVIAIAGVALIVDLVTALLTWAMSKSSQNIRAAFLHNLADALGSVAVIVAGTVILLYDWRLIDPIVTLGIAGYILWMSLAEIGGVVRVLMLGTPPAMAMTQVLDVAMAVPGVHSIHHAHLWQMEENRAALEAHLVIDQGSWADADAIKARVKTALQERFGIGHLTLETECRTHACENVQVVGHRR